MAGHETVAEAVLTLSEVQVSSGFTSWRGERELLKERRKSLTPVITALSPSGHIRSAERLTDPAGKSFTARTPPQRSHERSFLSTCLHFSDVPTLKVHTLQLFSRPGEKSSSSTVRPLEGRHQDAFEDSFTRHCSPVPVLLRGVGHPSPEASSSSFMCLNYYA